MPIGKVWIYRLAYCLFFFVILCVCTITDFSAEDKASYVTFCTAVRRPGQGFTVLRNFAPRSPKSDESESAWGTPGHPNPDVNILQNLR